MKKLISLILVLSLTSVYGANRVKTWSSEILTSSDLNTEFSNIYIGDISRSAGYWGSNDDIPVFVGSSQDTRIEWDTTQTTDSTLVGLGAGLILSVMELADMSTDWGIASQTNPTLFVHSADAAATTDYISLTHDQTNAVISNGIGSINLVVEGATADGYETTVTFTDPTADQTVTIANATGTVMLTSVAANGADLANSVTGAANSLIFEGATANGYETTLTATDPTADRTITLPDGGGTVVITGGTDLTVADGGTGASTFTDGGVLLGSGTGAITPLAVLGDGEIVIGDGSGDPVALDVGSSTSITILGTIATGTWQATDVGVGYGGTGASSFTDGGVLLGSGSGALTPMSVLSDSELIVGDGTGDPVAESGATLRTSIGVGTGDSPQFTALTLTAGTVAVLEGATDDGNETSIAVTDPTADRTVTFADAAGTVMLTSLAANGADLANAVTGGSSSLIFEGATANGYETTLTVTDPTADRTITFPDAAGTVRLTGGTDVSVADGGTGASSLTDGGGLLGSGTGAITPMSVLGDGEIVIGDGSGDPVALDIGSSTAVTIVGTIATGTWQATDVGVAYGGTGASSLTDGGILLGSGTGAITALGVAANGQIPIGDGSTDPVLATLTGTSNEIGIANGGGSITIGLPDDVTIPADLTIGGNDIIGAGNMGLGTAAVGTKDGILHIESTVNGTPALIVEVPSGATANGIQFHTGGASAIDIMVKNTVTSVGLNTRDLGNDAQGPQVNIGRNSNGTQASGGQIKFFDLGGDGHFLHVDNSGIVRVGTANPIGSDDTDNTIVGTQSSYQYNSDGSLNKDIIRELTPAEGLESILPTKFYEGKYTNGSYNGGTFFWPLAEEAPHLMEDPYGDLLGGRSHSPISHASLNSLAIQELYNKIEVLENEIISLRRNLPTGSVVAFNN